MKNGINNMFDSRHYVPILKWKRAEQGALETLNMENKKYITPLIQFVMPKQKNPQEQLEDIVKRFEKQTPQIPEKIVEVWGNTSIFVDFSLLFTTELKVKSLNSILKEENKFKTILIPVIYLNDDCEIKEAAYSLVKENRNGMCLRLICSDFSDLLKLNQNITELISSAGLAEKDVDLLVDIKETEKNGNKYIKYFDLSQKIPNLLKWRTFIFASGAFPEDLSQCKIDEENLIPRLDWKIWKNRVDSKKLQRKPAFADYTIQHPIYKEASQFFPPTTSIKYTLENEWLIMKGERQKFDKYLASAALLVNDKRFYGENFSDGDKYIAEKAKHFPVYMKNPAIKGTGSTETWLRAGINHHLVLVAHWVANLP
ncbi:beta family protein [Patescibacteria group bacterium]|nr:beta family protein [Patescibacteria group bacterium]MBU4480825.1 beta family protein [Patescibacteria group bacterium]